MLKRTVLAFAGIALAFVGAHAANVATDNAGDPVYDNGWQTGDNGGTGFGAWTLNGGAGTAFFVNSSTLNAGGSSGGIDTGGRALGMFANNDLAEAIRPLTGGSLLVGQSITLQLDNGFIQSGGSAGFDLRDSTGNARLSFYFQGGGTNYTVFDSMGTRDSGVGFTGNGLSIAFTLTGTDTYSISITPNGGGTTVVSNNLAGTAGTGIVDMRFFNFNAGTNQDSNFYINNLAVVPEPTTLSLLGGPALLGAWFLARRKRA